MKLKTTAILAVCGVLASAAAAFAIPVEKPVATADPASSSRTGAGVDSKGPGWDKGARITAGDTLLLEVRLERYVRGIWKFWTEARVEDKVVTEAELMCTVRPLKETE